MFLIRRDLDVPAVMTAVCDGVIHLRVPRFPHRLQLQLLKIFHIDPHPGHGPHGCYSLCKVIKM
jgi:hypothetical protein